METEAKQRRAVITSFQAYRQTMDNALADVEAALGRGEFALASRAMSEISNIQAKASIEMRGTLVRHGFLAREATDD